MVPVGDDVTGAGDEHATTDPVDTVVRVGDVLTNGVDETNGHVNGDDAHDGRYPVSSTYGDDVNGIRGHDSDGDEDGMETSVKDGRVGSRVNCDDATGHGRAGDGVPAGGDLADGSVPEGPRSYTIGPNSVPDRPSNCTFGQAADVHMLPDDDVADGRRLDDGGRRRCNEDNGMDSGRPLDDMTAIAGDPTSAAPVIRRPKCNRRRPLKYRDA